MFVYFFFFFTLSGWSRRPPSGVGVWSRFLPTGKFFPPAVTFARTERSLVPSQSDYHQIGFKVGPDWSTCALCIFFLVTLLLHIHQAPFFIFFPLRYQVWGSLRVSVCPCILGSASRSIWLAAILLSCQAENWHGPLKAVLMFDFYDSGFIFHSFSSLESRAGGGRGGGRRRTIRSCKHKQLRVRMLIVSSFSS